MKWTPPSVRRELVRQQRAERTGITEQQRQDALLRPCQNRTCRAQARVLDHDHACHAGKAEACCVRGWLCHRCNQRASRLEHGFPPVNRIDAGLLDYLAAPPLQSRA